MNNQSCIVKAVDFTSANLVYRAKVTLALANGIALGVKNVSADFSREELIQCILGKSHGTIEAFAQTRKKELNRLILCNGFISDSTISSNVQRDSIEGVPECSEMQFFGQ